MWLLGVSTLLLFVPIFPLGSASPPVPSTLTKICNRPVKVGEKLGNGHTASAYAADFGDFKQEELVVKISSIPSGPRFIETSRLAMELLAENPHGVPVYDSCLDHGDYLFVIMPRVYGKTIIDTITQTERYKDVSTREANILLDFCQFVKGHQYIHAHGCARLDVRPHNAIRTEQGVRVLDYYDSMLCSEEGFQQLAETDGWRMAATLVLMMGDFPEKLVYSDNSDNSDDSDDSDDSEYVNDSYIPSNFWEVTKEVLDSMSMELRGILNDLGYNVHTRNDEPHEVDVDELYTAICEKKVTLFKDAVSA